MSRGTRRYGSWRVEEGDGGVAVAAGLVAVQVLMGAVLDRKNARERLAAEVRDQTSGLVGGVWRVRQDEVEITGRQSFNIPERVATVNRHGIIQRECRDVLPKRL